MSEGMGDKVTAKAEEAFEKLERKAGRVVSSLNPLDEVWRKHKRDIDKAPDSAPGGAPEEEPDHRQHESTGE